MKLVVSNTGEELYGEYMGEPRKGFARAFNPFTGDNQDIALDRCEIIEYDDNTMSIEMSLREA